MKAARSSPPPETPPAHTTEFAADVHLVHDGAKWKTSSCSIASVWRVFYPYAKILQSGRHTELALPISGCHTPSPGARPTGFECTFRRVIPDTWTNLSSPQHSSISDGCVGRACKALKTDCTVELLKQPPGVGGRCLG